jgi:VWFA-related protein
MSFATLGAAIILGEMKSFNEMSATGTRRLLALAVVGLLLGPAPWAAQEPPPPSGGTFRVDVNVVNVYCTVKDGKGRLIADLEREDFDIKEDGTAQELKYFVRETDRPLTLVLAVDTSGSQRQVLAVEKTVGAQFLEQVLRPSDLAALVTFDVNVDLLQDFTQEAERLDRALQRARINAPVLLGPLPRNPPGTRLYDAVYLASKEKLGREVGRKAIILVSDGVDMGSHYKKEEALEAAQRADVMVYSIGISDPGVYGRPTGGRGTLKKLSEETGGRAIFPDGPRELKEAFDQIAAELRSQYTLGYTPTNRARDGKFRKVRVKVKRKGLKVQARRGYYAPRS